VVCADDEPLGEAIARADESLYAAKAARRKLRAEPRNERFPAATPVPSPLPHLI
jgi:hypothetical protein